MIADMPAIMALLNMRSCPVMAYRRKFGTSRWNSCLIWKSSFAASKQDVRDAA